MARIKPRTLGRSQFLNPPRTDYQFGWLIPISTEAEKQAAAEGSNVQESTTSAPRKSVLVRVIAHENHYAGYAIRSSKPFLERIWPRSEWRWMDHLTKDRGEKAASAVTNETAVTSDDQQAAQ